MPTISGQPDDTGVTLDGTELIPATISGVTGKIHTSQIATLARGAAAVGAPIGITTSEALAAGDLVNIWSSTGAKARKADGATTGKEADGFVLAAVLSGSTAQVYPLGVVTGLSGLTVGPVWLSDTTPGGVTSTPPTTAGHTLQYVGKAISATALLFSRGEPIPL